jgi:hypothetical protein
MTEARSSRAALPIEPRKSGTYRTDAEHGYGAYTRGCRCDTCRAAKREYVARRRAAGLEVDLRPKHGRRPSRPWRPPYNPQPARDHCRRLIKDLGWNASAIARVAGLERRTVERVLSGERMHRGTGDRILGVLPVPYARPNQRRITRTCECGVRFTVRPCEPQKFCSRACAGRAAAAMPRPSHYTYTDRELIGFLIRAANGQRTLSVLTYRRWAEANGAPTNKTVIARLGPTWNDVVRRAGLTPTPAARSYTRKWDDAALLAIAAQAVSDGCRTAVEYDAWATTRPDAPSGSLLRMRFGRWSHIVALATHNNSVSLGVVNG